MVTCKTDKNINTTTQSMSRLQISDLLFFLQMAVAMPWGLYGGATVDGGERKKNLGCGLLSMVDRSVVGELGGFVVADLYGRRGSVRWWLGGKERRSSV